MRGIPSLILLVLMLALLAGCNLDGYTRTYAVAAEDRFGQRLEIGMTLEPKRAQDMSVDIQRLEQAGVIMPGAVLKPDPAPVPMVPASARLAILTGPDSAPAIHSPSSPSSASVWLTRDGALRLETHPEVIAMRRAAGWRDAPPPGFEDGFAPAWRNGRWVVKQVKGGSRD